MTCEFSAVKESLSCKFSAVKGKVVVREVLVFCSLCHLCHAIGAANQVSQISGQGLVVMSREMCEL